MSYLRSLSYRDGPGAASNSSDLVTAAAGLPGRVWA